MIDPTTEFGARALKRLQEETVIWLTTVSPSGTPQPNPVWFSWDGETILIYSQPEAVKVRNIKGNPWVSLNLETNESGEDVVILTGQATLEQAGSSMDSTYEKKYREAIVQLEAESEEDMSTYNTLIRVKPERVRGF